jgi:hypothetical protein
MTKVVLQESTTMEAEVLQFLWSKCCTNPPSARPSCPFPICNFILPNRLLHCPSPESKTCLMYISHALTTDMPKDPTEKYTWDPTIMLQSRTLCNALVLKNLVTCFVYSSQSHNSALCKHSFMGYSVCNSVLYQAVNLESRPILCNTYIWMMSPMPRISWKQICISSTESLINWTCNNGSTFRVCYLLKK